MRILIIFQRNSISLLILMLSLSSSVFIASLSLSLSLSNSLSLSLTHWPQAHTQHTRTHSPNDNVQLMRVIFIAHTTCCAHKSFPKWIYMQFNLAHWLSANYEAYENAQLRHVYNINNILVVHQFEFQYNELQFGALPLHAPKLFPNRIVFCLFSNFRKLLLPILFVCFISLRLATANCQTTAVYQLYPTIAILMTV